jgi:hypothetical protein
MARCEVIQIQCDRCKRVELRPPSPPKEKPDLDLIFKNERLTYQDLCQSCAPTVARLIEDLKEWDREVKQQFGPTVPPNEAPPVQVAPNYTPPQPHSVAATKR